MKQFIIAVCFASAGLCLAGDGVWNVDANGVWSDTANWAGGSIADGVGSKASFTNTLTSDRTITINGAALSPTLGSIDIGAIVKGLTVGASNAGFLTLDNGSGAATIITTTNNFNTLTFSAPITLAGNKRLDLYNNYNGDRYLKLTGKISGSGVIIANRGTGNASVSSIEAANDFTGELWAVSDKSRLNVQFNGAEETAGGDPYNVIRVFPGGRLTLARYSHVVVNPLRTIIMEGQGVSGIGVFYNSGEGNEKKHVPASITGDGGLQTTANFVLSGLNTFTGTLQASGGTLQFASLRNLGAGTLVVDGYGTTVCITGTELASFGAHSTSFNTGNNGGTWISLSDPNLVFTMDRTLDMSLNSNGATALGKNGAGEFVFTVPQTFRNNSGRMLSLEGGMVTVDYAAGAVLAGTSVNDGNRLGFKGGTLKLRTTGCSTNVAQKLGDLWLYGDGGKLVVDNRNADGTATVNMGTLFLKNTTVDNGQTLSLDVFGDTSKVTLTSTATNDATGIWGVGRIIFLGSDWPCIETGTNRVIAYSGYTALAVAGSSANAWVSGDGTVAAGQTVNTLKIETTGAGQSLEIDDSAMMTLAGGAVLFTGSDDYAVHGGHVQCGRAASDLIIHQFGSGTLTLDTDLVFTNGISSFTKTGPGKVVLTREPILGGQMTIADGVLELSDPLSITYTNGTLTGVTSLTTASVVTSTAAELPYGLVPGSALLGRTLNQIGGASGNWTLTLSGNANAALSGGSTTFTTRPTVRNNGTLRMTQSMTIANQFVYGGNGATFDVADGALVQLTGGKSGGCFILENTDPTGSGVARVNGMSEMGAGLYIRRGVYEANSDNISASGANPLVFGDGEIATFRVQGGKTVLVAELSGTNVHAIVETRTSGTTLFGILNGGDNRFDGVIRDGTGVIRLIKGGGGTLTLNGANTYSGATDVKGGVLAVNGSLASGSQVNVQGGALAGTGTVGPVVVTGKGKLAPGTGGAGTLTTGTLTLGSGATLDCELGGVGTSDRITVNGDLVLDGTLKVTGLSGFGAGRYVLMTYTGTLTNNGLTVGTIPDSRLNYMVSAANGEVVLSVSHPGTVVVVQ